MRWRPLGNITRVTVFAGPIAKVAFEPRSVATHPAVSLSACTRRGHAVSAIPDSTAPRLHIPRRSIAPIHSAILVVHEPFPVHARDRPRAIAVVRDRFSPRRPISSLPGNKRRIANRRACLLPALARQFLLIPVDRRRVAEALHGVRVARCVDAILEGIIAPAFGKSSARRAGAKNGAKAQCN